MIWPAALLSIFTTASLSSFAGFQTCNAPLILLCESLCENRQIREHIIRECVQNLHAFGDFPQESEKLKGDDQFVRAVVQQPVTQNQISVQRLKTGCVREMLRDEGKAVLRFGDPKR